MVLIKSRHAYTHIPVEWVDNVQTSITTQSHTDTNAFSLAFPLSALALSDVELVPGTADNEQVRTWKLKKEKIMTKVHAVDCLYDDELWVVTCFEGIYQNRLSIDDFLQDFNRINKKYGALTAFDGEGGRPNERLGGKASSKYQTEVTSDLFIPFVHICIAIRIQTDSRIKDGYMMAFFVFLFF